MLEAYVDEIRAHSVQDLTDDLRNVAPSTL